MSAIASFYLIRKEKFAEFCKMAQLVPLEQVRIPEGVPVLRAITTEEMNSAEFKKEAQHYQKIWNYLRQNSKEPFEFHWSGYVLADLLVCLKEVKSIDLMSVAYAEKNGEGDFLWWVLNTDVKQKYFRELTPSKYSESSLKELYRRNEELFLQKFAKELSKKDFEQAKQMRATMKSDFPELGRAFLEGINVIHEYMKLIDENSIVLVHVG